jgi:hypothetical protein
MKKSFSQKAVVFAACALFTFSLQGAPAGHEVPNKAPVAFSCQIPADLLEQLQKKGCKMPESFALPAEFQTLMTLVGQLKTSSVECFIENMDQEQEKYGLLSHPTHNEMRNLVGTALMQGIRFKRISDGLQIANHIMNGMGPITPPYNYLESLVEDIVYLLKDKHVFKEKLVEKFGKLKNPNTRLISFINTLILPEILTIEELLLVDPSFG